MALDFSNGKNATKAKHMQEKMLTEGNAPIARLLPMDVIVENKDNELIYDMNKLDDLIENIGEDGFTDPIGVYDLKNGKYEIFSGHKRFRAMKERKETTIPCLIFPMPKDDIERARRLIKSNSLNRDYTPLVKAKELQYYNEHVIIPENKPGEKRAQLAKEFGMSGGQVSKLLSLLQLIPELQELANNPELAFSAFSPAAQLSKEQQKELYHTVMDSRREDGSFSMTRGDILNYIKKLQGIEEKIEEKIKEQGEQRIEEQKAENHTSQSTFMHLPEIQTEIPTVTDVIEEPSKNNEQRNTFPVEAPSGNFMEPISHINSSPTIAINHDNPSPVLEISHANLLPVSESRREEGSSSEEYIPPIQMDGGNFIEPAAPSDIEFILKMQLNRMKQIDIQNMQVLNADNVRQYIKDFKEILENIENTL